MFSDIFITTDWGDNSSSGCRETVLRKGGDYIHVLEFYYKNYNEEDINNLKNHFAFKLFVDKLIYNEDGMTIKFIFKENTPIKVSKFFITLFRVFLYYHGDYYKFVHDVFYYRSAGYRYNYYPLVQSWDYGNVTFSLYFLESFMFFNEDYFIEFVNSKRNHQSYSVVKFPHIENIDKLLVDFIKKVNKPSALKHRDSIIRKINFYMEKKEEW